MSRVRVVPEPPAFGVVVDVLGKRDFAGLADDQIVCLDLLWQPVAAFDPAAHAASGQWRVMLFGVVRKALAAVHAATAGHGSFQLDAGLDVTAPRADPTPVTAAIHLAFRIRVIGQTTFPRR